MDQIRKARQALSDLSANVVNTSTFDPNAARIAAEAVVDPDAPALTPTVTPAIAEPIATITPAPETNQIQPSGAIPQTDLATIVAEQANLTALVETLATQVQQRSVSFQRQRSKLPPGRNHSRHQHRLERRKSFRIQGSQRRPLKSISPILMW
jgi:hypothetical protein